ncbi:MAG: DUF368 domain-containing protein [bacterium]|nr:DUF368 domain-containing protein [bacterium]
MKAILLLIKGFIMGIANVIPGVSGGTLAIILGIYEKLINILSCLWKNIKENLKFLVPLFLGMGIAIIAGSYVIDWGLTNFPIATTMFFIGLVIGGIPFIYIKVHKKYSILNVCIFIIIMALVILISLWSMDRTVSLNKLDFLLVLRLFCVGVIAAATMIIPGISGSLVLMNLGYYESIISAIKGLSDFSQFGHNFCVLLPFGIGVIVGLVLVARLIKWLINRFPVQSYFGILAFVIASIVSIIIGMNKTGFNVSEFALGFLLLVVGAFITFILARYDYIKNAASEGEEEKEIETTNEVVVENKENID